MLFGDEEEDEEEEEAMEDEDDDDHGDGCSDCTQRLWMREMSTRVSQAQGCSPKKAGTESSGSYTKSNEAPPSASRCTATTRATAGALALVLSWASEAERASWQEGWMDWFRSGTGYKNAQEV